jgi:hypothetical protein
VINCSQVNGEEEEEYRKTCIFASLSLQVVFAYVITYLDRIFKEEQNDINFKTKQFY